MASTSLALSPLFPSYSTGEPSGLAPNVRGNILNRLILQDGSVGGKDEYNMDTLSVSFKIFAGSDWKRLLPARGDTITGFPNFIVWDPNTGYTLGKVSVLVRVNLKGLINLNGVSNQWDGFLLNPKPRDSTGVASVQISGTDGSSTMDLTFYRPQTSYKYLTTTEIVDPPQTVTNPTKRIPVPISYAVRGSTDVPDKGDDDSDGPATYVGYNVGTRQRCIDVSTTQVGKYFVNDATVVYEFYDTANPS